MLEKLKKQPLIGLALAVAAGLVVAHLTIRLGDYFWENYFAEFIDQNGWVLFGLTVAAVGIFFLVRWLRQKGKLQTWSAALKSLWKLNLLVSLAAPFVSVICYKAGAMSPGWCLATVAWWGASFAVHKCLYPPKLIGTTVYKGQLVKKETICDFIFDSNQRAEN